MAAGVRSKSRTIATWGLRIVLGLAFLAVGTTKLAGTRHTVEYFAAIGWGQWFRYLTGVVDIGGAAMLFVPRWTCYGAIARGCRARIESADLQPLTEADVHDRLVWVEKTHSVVGPQIGILRGGPTS
jgi:DoxX-like protein